MGLDITAYSHLKLAGKMCNSEDEYAENFCEENHVSAFAYASFPRSYEGLAGADEVLEMGWAGSKFIGGYCYAFTDKTESTGFCAGSYGGYGYYRNALSDCFLDLKKDLAAYPTDENYWERLAKMTDVPFYELINFADNEGSIGPVAAEKLYHNHVEGRDAFLKHSPDYIHLYDNWTHAFDLARNDGLVHFH